MADSLHCILKLSEREPPVLGVTQTITWPEGDLERWVATGVLRPISPTTSLPCLGCAGEHVGEVVYLTDPGTGTARAYLPCPQCGPSAVSPAALQRWAVEVVPLVELVFTDSVTAVRLTCLHANRLWRVGKSTGPDGSFTVFFGRQLHRADAAEILQRARIPPNSVVFVPLHTPPPSAEPKGPLVLPIIPVISSAGTIQFDWQGVGQRVAEWRQGQDRPEKRSLRKRASRAADIAALTKELQAHLRAARDYAVSTRDRSGEPKLLPRPTQEDLARRIDASQWTVSRCLGDPEARELHYLWELAVDLERILAHANC